MSDSWSKFQTSWRTQGYMSVRAGYLLSPHLASRNGGVALAAYQYHTNLQLHISTLKCRYLGVDWCRTAPACDYWQKLLAWRSTFLNTPMLSTLLVTKGGGINWKEIVIVQSFNRAILPQWHWKCPQQMLVYIHIHVDIAGSHGSHYCLSTFQYMRLKHFAVRSATSCFAIHCLKGLFARLGVLDTVVSDSGACFVSSEFGSLRVSGILNHRHYPID